MTKKFSIVFAILLIVVMTVLSGCSTDNSAELESLRKENKLLQQENSQLREQISALGETIPSTASSSEDTNTFNEEFFESIEYSGSGDKVITDVNLPEGIFIATISIDSEDYYAVKYHFDDDYQLLVNDSGTPYYGVVVIKGNTVASIDDGLLEITSKGTWQIKIDKLSENCSTNISGSGDRVSGIFKGTGSTDVVSIEINSSEYYAVKLYEFDLSYDNFDYDLLVNDSGAPYTGETVAKLDDDMYYFVEVSAKGTWSIDFGHGDLETKYFEIPSFTESKISEDIASEYTQVPTAGNIPVETTEPIVAINIVENTFNTMMNLTKDDCTINSLGQYVYQGLPLLDNSINKNGSIQASAIYRKMALCLEAFELGNDWESYAPFILGYVPNSRSDFANLVDDLSAFIVNSQPANSIRKKFQSMASVEVTAEENRYTIAIDNLATTAREMGISDEMMGHILCGMYDGGASVSFEGDGCIITYTDYLAK